MTAYPQVLQWELSSACNAACRFCPHSSIHEHGRMSDSLLHKLQQEVEGWKHKPTSLCPFLTNEPFVDRRVFPLMEWTARQGISITMFTNGSLLNADARARLAPVADKFSVFMVSLHSLDPQEYAATTGLTLEPVLENVRALRAEYPGLPLRLLRVSEGRRGDEAFVEGCAHLLPGIPIMVAQRWNWKGDRPWPVGEPHQDIVCPRTQHLVVRHNGRVALCCMDQEAHYALGDVNQQTMLEVFNSDIRRRYGTTLKRDLIPCNRCNMH